MAKGGGLGWGGGLQAHPLKTASHGSVPCAPFFFLHHAVLRASCLGCTGVKTDSPAARQSRFLLQAQHGERNPRVNECGSRILPSLQGGNRIQEQPDRGGRNPCFLSHPLALGIFFPLQAEKMGCYFSRNQLMLVRQECLSP